MVEIASGMVRFAFLSCLLFGSSLSALKSLSMVRDGNLPRSSTFKVYWNVPTFMCKQHGFDFSSEMAQFGITANSKDEFRGEQISLLYDPGEFPMVVKNKTTGEEKVVNGGIPQEGDLNKHLDEFVKAVEKNVAKNFAGLAVIDFEVWRPIFRQHWNAQTLYRNMSLDRVRKSNPNLSEDKVKAIAKQEFEDKAKEFMEQTLIKAKELRPNAKWGYYGFPYCLNYGKEDNSADCPQMVKKENDQIDWLFQNSQAFYMSVYSTKNYSAKEHEYFVTARMNEAARLAAKVNPFPGVFPYVWYRHHDDENNFMTEDKLKTVLETIKKYELGGAIMWGASGELKTKEQCQKLKDYLTTTLGPVISKVVQN